MNYLRTAIGLFIICAVTFGGTITINSAAVNTINDTGLSTIEILKHASWTEPFEGSAWVSTLESGDSTQTNFFEFDNGTTITFSHRFSLPAQATGGSLSVMADDTASVSLNGVLLFPVSTVSGPACSANAIGCLDSTAGVVAFSLMQPHLVAGTNVLSFAVQQRDGAAFGLTYSGYFDYQVETRRVADEHTPEPASFLLSTTGLVIGALIVRRRRP